MRLAVLTTGRQDWGILRSTCAALRTETEISLSLWAGGMHLAPTFGETVRSLEVEGFVLEERLAFGAGNDVFLETAEAVRLVGHALERHRPDALLLVGDRSETAAAALAAVLARVPIVHLHGGEETEGAVDNVLRHAVSKMAHLHLVSHREYAARLRAMGEDPATIHVVGAPGLDNLRRPDLASRAELEELLGMELRAPLVIVTVHPTTLASEGASGEADGDDGQSGTEVQAVVAAMAAVDATYVVTLPNADRGHERIREILRTAVARSSTALPRAVAAEALGERRYWGLLRLADAMLGNSSSGVIEAPALGLPVVNVGDRQKGRLRAGNILDVPFSGRAEVDAHAVASALREALTPAFRQRARAATRTFGDGRSAEAIVSILRGWVPPKPPRKAPVVA